MNAGLAVIGEHVPVVCRSQDMYCKLHSIANVVVLTAEEGSMNTQALSQHRISTQWTLEVLSAQGGIVPTVNMQAIHRGGSTEHFDVGLWPSGWRILRLGLTAPKAVRNAAIRIAAEGTGLPPVPKRSKTAGKEHD